MRWQPHAVLFYGWSTCVFLKLNFLPSSDLANYKQFSASSLRKNFPSLPLCQINKLFPTVYRVVYLCRSLYTGVSLDAGQSSYTSAFGMASPEVQLQIAVSIRGRLAYDGVLVLAEIASGLWHWLVPSNLLTIHPAVFILSGT